MKTGLRPMRSDEHGAQRDGRERDDVGHDEDGEHLVRAMPTSLTA